MVSFNVIMDDALAFILRRELLPYYFHPADLQSAHMAWLHLASHGPSHPSLAPEELPAVLGISVGFFFAVEKGESFGEVRM